MPIAVPLAAAATSGFQPGPGLIKAGWGWGGWGWHRHWGGWGWHRRWGGWGWHRHWCYWHPYSCGGY
jgi:hypothetical protein